MDDSILHRFSNIGHMLGGRNFAGFPSSTSGQRFVLEPRGSHMVEMQQGDLLALSTQGGQQDLAVFAFTADGSRAEHLLNLPTATGFSDTDVQPDRLLHWLRQRGIDNGALPPSPARATASDDPLVLRASGDVTVWVLHSVSADNLVLAEDGTAVEICHQRKDGKADLPPVLGNVRDEFTVDRATARSYRLRPGEYVQIIDVEGQQCSDFQALRLRGLDAGESAMIDGTATRSMLGRTYAAPGLQDKFFDADMRPMLRVVQDTCGRHDTFGLACTARGYEDRGFPGHVNCSDNISHALAEYGVAPRLAWPAINFFWNTWVDQHHHMMTEESFSRPGDYVVMEALDDLACVTTACPDDLDPINGWNPTDVHVRIYSPEKRILRAVAYRSREDAPMQISQESVFHPRTATMTDQFAPARDLWTPTVFPSSGTTGEYWACRSAATLQDMSGLRKFDVIGPDAERLLQQAMTRDVAKLAVWRGTYGLLCDPSGEVIDDGTLFRLAPNVFRWCCGSEESGRSLQALAQSMGLQVRVHDLGGALPNLALQGPKSRDILRDIVFTQPHVPSIEHLKWFGATVARLHHREGAPFMLTRSGYTGELGYEVFCAKDHALEIWDAIMEAGEPHGIAPMGSAALEVIRIEAGLAAANAEFAPGVDAFEAGLGFAVDLKKADFVGRNALERNAASPRRHLRGLLLDCDDVPAHGAPVWAGERQVGVVTSATRSPMLERSIAMARISVENSAEGTKLEIGQLDGRMKRLSATVTTIPFVDPKRERARA